MLTFHLQHSFCMMCQFYLSRLNYWKKLKSVEAYVLVYTRGRSKDTELVAFILNRELELKSLHFR